MKNWAVKQAIEDDQRRADLKRKQQEEREREKKQEARCCGCLKKKKVKLTEAQKEERRSALWTMRVKSKKSDNHYKKATKQGWQGEPEPYSAKIIETPAPTVQQKNLQQEGFGYQMYYYFQTFLALFIFAFVADKIINWFQPGYLVKFVDEWASFGQIFTYAFQMIKKLIFFIFKLPEIIVEPLYR